MVTKLSAAGRRCEFFELLYGYSRRFCSVVKSFLLEDSSLVLYTGGSDGIASSSPSGIEILR